MAHAAQISSPGEKFTMIDTPATDPGPGQVRISVHACGICRSDEAVIGGLMPGSTFPLTPGHEIAGEINAVGAEVSGWQVGDRVAVGWFGGCDGTCAACLDGDALNCPRLQIPGVSYPGGYAESVIVPQVALARIPLGLTYVEAAPMACAGVTAFNALRSGSARAGDLVAVVGLGGVGHLAVQFAAKMGFRTVAVARGIDKREAAMSFGAIAYVDSTRENVAEALQAMGGARMIIGAASSSAAISAAVDGLSRHGELVITGGAFEPLHITGLQLMFGSRSVRAHASGTAPDTEATLQFAERTGVRALIETAPLADAEAAFSRMVSNQARFRVVLTTS